MSASLLGLLVMGNFVAYGMTVEASEGGRRDVQLTELTGRLLYLDEVLTMSTHMAVATGAPHWVTRYHAHEPELDATLASLAAQARDPRERAAIETVNSANAALVAAESAAFRAVATGALDEARAALEGKAYRAEKQRYSAGVQRLAGLVHDKVARASRVRRRHSSWLMSALGVVSLALMCLFVFILARWWRNLQRHTRQLAEAEAQIRLLLTSMSEGIVGVDTRGHAAFVNPAAIQMLGYDEHTLRTQPLHALVKDLDIEAADALRDALRAGQLATGAQARLQRADGTGFDVEYSATPLIEGGERVGAVFLFADATEKRRVERMKEEFISTVSHELRTPLTAMKGAIGLCRSGKLGTIPAPMVQMLTIAAENSDRLEFLVNDLLELNKIAAMGPSFQMESLAFNALVQQGRDASEAYAAKFGIALAWVFDAPERTPIRGDAKRLLQVLLNLVSNAVKYAPDGTPVTIRTACEDGEAVLTVTDHGPGIPPAFRARAFDKFTQADSSDTRRVEGTGLGLAISKDIVEGHSGRISFECPAEGGTVFRVVVPRAD